MGCAQIAKDIEENLIGTAPHYQNYILIEDDQKLWEMGIKGSSFRKKYYDRYEHIDLFCSMLNEQQKGFLQPLLIAKDSVSEVRKVFIYNISSMGYCGYEYNISSLSQIPSLLLYHFFYYKIPIPLLVREMFSRIGQQHVEENYFVSTLNNTPLVAICNHSRYDKCCSMGKIIYNEFLHHKSIDVWRCSHLGGHRFASTLVAFPQGRYYGFIETSDVAELATCIRDNKPFVKKYRGWGILHENLQVAEHYGWTSAPFDEIMEVHVEPFSDMQVKLTRKYKNNKIDNLLVELKIQKSEHRRYTSCSDIKTDNEKKKSSFEFSIISSVQSI